MFGKLFGTCCAGLCSLVAAMAVASGNDGDSLAGSIPDGVTRTSREFAAYLEGNFRSDEERVSALYTWLGYSVSYDLSLMEDLQQYEDVDALVAATLKTRKAVCQGYAEAFTAICNAMHIPALTVHGYNRIDGQIRTEPGHAWNIAKVNGKWHLFDPTWGSGYLDNGRYRRQFTTSYFMTPPDTLLATHMPLDPIWQLKDYPVTHDQYQEGKIRGEIFYDFPDSLDQYFLLDEAGRAENSLRRALQDHADLPKLSRIFTKFASYTENVRCNVQITRYNGSSLLLQEAIDIYNAYQKGRHLNKAGTPSRQIMLDSASARVKQASLLLQTVTPCRALQKLEIQRLSRQVQEVNAAIQEIRRQPGH